MLIQNNVVGITDIELWVVIPDINANEKASRSAHEYMSYRTGSCMALQGGGFRL